jgi:hypothetical protein
MKLERINNRKQLKARIRMLTRQMEEKEEVLKSDLKEVHQSLRASNMIRNAIKDIREQPELKLGLAQAAADMGAHALIDKVVFRKNRNLKNYLISIVLKRIADHFILKERKKKPEPDKSN